MSHYDDLEIRSSDEREADLAEALARAVSNAQTAPALARALRDVDPGMLVNIEHEDTELGRIEGLAVAAAVLKDADAALEES